MEKKRIFNLIVYRLIAVSALLVAVVILQYSTGTYIPIIPFYYLIGLAYLLSIGYLIFWAVSKNYQLQAYLQIILDLLLITTLVYISGGLMGSFYFLYLFPIMAASLLIGPRASLLVASLSAILFGLLVDGLYFRLIPYFLPEQKVTLSLGQVLTTLITAWAVFFVMSILMNVLSGRLKKIQEELVRAKKELEVRERLATAGKLAAQLAHEIRNPLAAVSGAVQVLRDELELKDDQQKLMGIILKESERVSQIIEQFLDLASPLGKKTFVTFDVGTVVEETLTMLEAAGELNGRIKIVGNFRNEKFKYYGNPNQFKQVFWNLIRNAIKAMPDGGTLGIDLAEHRRELRISISDTGRGFNDEEKQHLFEPFFSSFENGRGLGMSVVRRIVDDYEGRILVRSSPKKGTTITVVFPVRKE
ncbi:MAG: ATP-binding protein [Candidatus Aminicenantes bacterium]|nr:ATP-binding protein [Candidatus Aminicenantes bacterium]